MEKDEVKKELARLIEIREDMYEFLDKNIAKSKDGGYDFSQNPTLDAKTVYEKFFKLDYQARKIRSFLVKAYDLKP